MSRKRKREAESDPDENHSHSSSDTADSAAPKPAKRLKSSVQEEHENVYVVMVEKKKKYLYEDMGGWRNWKTKLVGRQLLKVFGTMQRANDFAASYYRDEVVFRIENGVDSEYWDDDVRAVYEEQQTEKLKYSKPELFSKTHEYEGSDGEQRRAKVWVLREKIH